MSDSRENAKKEFPEARELSMEELSKVVGGGPFSPDLEQIKQMLQQLLPEMQPGTSKLLSVTPEDVITDEMKTFSQTLSQTLQQLSELLQYLQNAPH